MRGSVYSGGQGKKMGRTVGQVTSGCLRNWGWGAEAEEPPRAYIRTTYILGHNNVM